MCAGVYIYIYNIIPYIGPYILYICIYNICKCMAFFFGDRRTVQGCDRSRL